GQSDPATPPGDPLRPGVSPALPPACPPARVYEGAVLRDLESDLPSPTRSGPGAPDRPAACAHRAGADHANAATAGRRSSAHALSSVSNGHLDPRGRPRSAPDACAMTMSAPDVARSSARPLAAWLRRSLPRRPVARM